MNKKNAGFSLVELIVVIAIMAVLVGVLAPAYLRYVEKSRKSADVTAVDEMIKAADTVTSDTQFNVPQGGTYTLSGSAGTITMTYSNGGSSTTSVDVYAADDNSSEIETEWKTVANIKTGEYDCRSREFGGLSGDASGVVSKDGSVAWSAEVDDESDLFGAMSKHSSDIKKKLSSATEESDS